MYYDASSRRALLTALLGVGMIAACRTAPPPPQPIAGGAAVKGATADTFFRTWPVSTEPSEVGRRVAANFAARPFNFQAHPRQRYVLYSEICAWYGALQVATLIRDQSLQEQLVRKFDIFMTREGARHISQRAHVEHRVFGAIPLEIFRLTRNKDYLTFGRAFADKQWQSTTSEGITTEARYVSDDLYMLPLLQVQAHRATEDSMPLDRAAFTMISYLNRLQQPNGLFLHGEDSPFYWARGNGWAAAGMAEVLSTLPAGHWHRPRILDSYRRMMFSLLGFQADEGLWRQLVDQPDFWLETSGTGMFAFAMASGVRQGWLNAETYGPAARSAWLGMVSRLDEAGNIRDVCIGTNKASAQVGNDLATQRKYYLDRPRRTGDLNGQAPVLWTAAALMRGTA